MTEHVHTVACQTDHRDCLRQAVAAKVADAAIDTSVDGPMTEPWEFRVNFEGGALEALRLYVQRDPEAMAAVGLAIDDEMVEQLAITMALIGASRGATREDVAHMFSRCSEYADGWRQTARAALEAALGGEQR